MPNPPARLIRPAPPVLLPPSRVIRQDATAPGSLYRSNPSSPAANSNERGSFTGAAVTAMRKALPINAAMFAQDLTGNKLPLTEKDLSSDEIAALRGAGRKTQQRPSVFGIYHNEPNRNQLNYDAYPDDVVSDPATFKQLRTAVGTPAGRMITTIGGAMLHKSPGNNTVLTDSYDFGGTDRLAYDYAKKIGVAPTTGQAIGNIVKDFIRPPAGQSRGDNMFNMLRYIEAGQGSAVDGKGIPVNINLGNLKRPMAGEFPAPRVLNGALPPKK